LRIATFVGGAGYAQAMDRGLLRTWGMNDRPMSNRTSLWMGLIGVAALVFTGCAVEPESGEVTLIDDDVYDPGFPVHFDAGQVADDAGPAFTLPERERDDRRADDLTGEAESLVGCGGATSWRCPEGTVCCPASQECVPAGDCVSDSYHRFMTPDALDAESLPDVDPVGPVPGDPDDGEPRGEPEDPDPGPMPPS